ncbi:hypothetical protein FSP39_015507 [Pinctada imbricata]|uniref:NAD(P)H oxidase (H2O2-forming) n=1 Tax=Pinctada imbricata TaxID=66713 RepID=A0AA88YEQ7_PINIB|nr:hypothetical protein FSP39_015507 [Pinctada imbricata]
MMLCTDEVLIRRSPPAYMDGVYEPAGQDRPNPFEISNVAHKGTEGLGSKRNRTAMMVFFGQQVVEEILDVQRPGCPREFFNIPVPVNHFLNPDKLDNLEMPLQRSRFAQTTGQSPSNPRQQLNEITPYIDGTLFYGPGKAWTDAIREFRFGYLKAKVPSSLDNRQYNVQFPADNDIRLPFANPPNPRDHELNPVKRYFRLGNPRGFENPFLLTFGVLFFRWHNYMADKIRDETKSTDDEFLFNEARKHVIAHHQKIVMYDWLPRWLKIEQDMRTFACIPQYNQSAGAPRTSTVCSSDAVCKAQWPHNVEFCRNDGYDAEIHPGISQEFQTAAMRFGHTLVTPGIWLRGSGRCNTSWATYKPIKRGGHGNEDEQYGVRLCNNYWVSQETVNTRLNDLIRGLSSTLSEQEDHVLVPDLREKLFGPLEFSRRDLAAINIQRAREHGLADYNTVREAFGLGRLNYSTMADIHLNPTGSSTEAIDAIQNLSRLHQQNFDNIDLFTGGMLETTYNGPGELFRSILMDQFLRIRHGDRFWFENQQGKIVAEGSSRLPLFTKEQIDHILVNITLRHIILKVTDIDPSELQDDVFINSNLDSKSCFTPFQLDTSQTGNTSYNYRGRRIIEDCTGLEHFDYFFSSTISFPLSFLILGLCVPATIGVMICMAKMRQRQMQTARRVRTPHGQNDDPNVFRAVEWVGPNSGERNVKITFERDRKKVIVEDMRKKPLRMINLRNMNKKVNLRLADDQLQNLISVRVHGEIDLILRFIDMEERAKFVRNLEEFLVSLGIDREKREGFTEKSVFDNAEHKEDRQKDLDIFFRVICLQAFNKTPGQMDIQNLNENQIKRVMNLQLTRTEFAEALGLKPTSIFVRNMFLMVDSDRSGFVGFSEFLDMFVVLSSGDAEDKARMIFNMYDLHKRGKLKRDEFVKMIGSMLDLSDSSISKGDMDNLIQTMYQMVGLPPNSDIDFESFKKIFASDSTLQNATLGIDAIGSAGRKGAAGKQSNKRKTFIQSYRHEDQEVHRKSRLKVKTKTKSLPQGKVQQTLYEITRYIENNRRQIFWCSLYLLVTAGIFLERAFYYSFEREHAGLRRIAGYGVTVTRGAASVMMFTYSSLLLTMSRNTITFLRETFFHRFIPFDSMHAFHKLIAAIALIFTVVHCVGHGINLYHICTQASTDLNCIFREYFRATDVLASFHYWAYGTITGLSGIILTLIVIVMYVFALPYARRNLFNAFWFTHSFYILLYIFLVMHGTGRLVQPPLFQNYFIGPAVVFLFDKIVSFSRKKQELRVFTAELLPSDVTALKFKRPLNFEYKSGQWVRIACLKLGESEYHPFTLTSAPHEDFLSLHIRAVGPWTTNLRNVYDANQAGENYKPPNVYVDGPFGEGHQDWYKFPVAVLVGGGIGVTPFASILKDIVYKSSTGAKFPCKKVYFLWVTRTQKQFEWLTDIIKDVENNDGNNLVSVHIFITQFQQKFDLRTTMLYICERHFQKIAGKSLFTGLKAITHFGRPKFQDFLESLHYEHPEASQIGVFSCGPPPMTLNVEKACTGANKNEGFPTYHHHFENF